MRVARRMAFFVNRYDQSRRHSGMDIAAATANAAAPRTGPGVASAFLPIHLLCRPGHVRTALCLYRAQTLVCLVHDHHVVQQLFADARGDFGRIDLVLADLRSAAIVYGQTGHVNVSCFNSGQ